MIDGILAEIPPLINESDLHISQLTLNLLTSLCCKHPKSMAKVCDSIMKEIFILVRSPLLQGKFYPCGSHALAYYLDFNVLVYLELIYVVKLIPSHITNSDILQSEQDSSTYTEKGERCSNYLRQYWLTALFYQKMRGFDSFS